MTKLDSDGHSTPLLLTLKGSQSLVTFVYLARETGASVADTLWRPTEERPKVSLDRLFTSSCMDHGAQQGNVVFHRKLT